jgi:hypothetical protein
MDMWIVNDEKYLICNFVFFNDLGTYVNIQCIASNEKSKAFAMINKHAQGCIQD